MLRWYQEEGIQRTFDYFEQYGNRSGNPIIAWPTGTGKSHFISGFIQEAFKRWPNYNMRFICLTHVKELIEQNANKLLEAWPQAPLGICSAGMKRRDVDQPIIFGGVATVKNEIEQIGYRDILFVDECHLVGTKEETMYLQILKMLRAFNPNIKVVGLTATPFRQGQGMLTESEDGSAIFTDIVHDMTRLDNFDRLIAEGFLSAPIPRATRTKLDLTGVRMSKGDFNTSQLQGAIDRVEITNAALQELIEYGQTRRSWLIFASGIEHAEHIADTLSMWGIPCAAVHSKMDTAERDARIASFKRGELRAIANNNILTTGFDHPPVDLIGMLRPTMSPSLWVQMVGRGTRPCQETGKQNCLVLDYAGNTKRLGPINDPRIPHAKGKTPGEIPVKICESCGVYNHTRARFCVGCGKEFDFAVKFEEKSAEIPLLRESDAVVETFNVDRVHYLPHKSKKGMPDGIRVSYFCGLRMFEEWVLLEHPGFIGHKARNWWRMRHRDEPPATTAQALTMTTWLRKPKSIRVHTNKQFPEVMSYEW